MGSGTVAGDAWNGIKSPWGIAAGLTGITGVEAAATAGAASGAADRISQKLDNAPTPTPPPNPGPGPTPVDPSPGNTQAATLRRLAALRMGIGSTFSQTGAGGLTTPALTSTPGLYATGTKTALGQ